MPCEKCKKIKRFTLYGGGYNSLDSANENKMKTSQQLAFTYANQESEDILSCAKIVKKLN